MAQTPSDKRGNEWRPDARAWAFLAFLTFLAAMAVLYG